ncbi:hypothetical protein SynWH8103_01385 [Synechococcus sp. WH 8103]|nr:hypothetical protein SynWH8103_01385 [Synechococcus sp. WH 8103]
MSHLLESNFQFTQGLFRISVGSILNSSSLLTAALNQALTLLLGLLPELQGIVVQPLGFLTALTLQAQNLASNGLQLLQGLLAAGFMLLGMLTLDLGSVLLKLLTALLSLLFQLLTACRELLLLLRQLALHLLLKLGALLSSRLQQLLALLACLFAQLQHLTLRLLSDRGGADQLLVLPFGLLNDLFRLLLCRIDEFVTSLQQLGGAFELLRKGLAHCVEHFDGITLVDQTPATEWNTTSLEKDILQLIQMVEDSEASVAHVTGVGKSN